MSTDYGIPQSGPVVPADMYDAIQDSLDALLSNSFNPSEPSYATAGMIWAKDVSSSIIEIYFYDGAVSIKIATFNPTTHTLTSLELADNQVSTAKMAQIATGRIMGRLTAGTGNVEVLTAAQVTAMLLPFVGDSGAGGVQGLVPAPGVGDGAAEFFLCADGVWKSPTSGMPPGAILDFAMDEAPTGWLMCYGQELSRATYAALYAKVGDAWGGGNGSTTFKAPDFRGRVRAGKDNMGGTSADRLQSGLTGGINGDTLANTGGSDRQTLTTAQIPPLTFQVPTTTGDAGSTNSAARGFSGGPGTINTNTLGGGGAHNNVQPTGIVITCIKF